MYSGPLAQAIVDTVKHPPLRPGSTRSVAPRRHGAERPRGLQGAGPRPDAHRLPRAGRLRHGAAVLAVARRSARSSTSSRAIRPRRRCRASEALHHYLEASRLAYADRGAFLADPGYVTSRWRSCSPTSSRRSAAPRSPRPRRPSPVPAGDPSAVTDTSASTTRVGSTTNLTVTDRWGNVVDYTFTIEQTGGNGMVVPGYGFLLNNELTDFNLTDEHRSGRPGGVSTGANKVAPGKRPRSSIAPTIVLRNGKPFLAARLAGRRVDHHDGGADPRQPPGLRDDAARRGRAPRLSQRNSDHDAERAGLPEHARGRRAQARGPDVRGDHRRRARQIGAATGIEFLPHGALQVGGRAGAPRRRQRRGRVVGRSRPGRDGHGGRHRLRAPHDVKRPGLRG